MAELNKALPMVKNLIRTHVKEDIARSMIFVPFIETGEAAAQYLNCKFYYSKSNSDTLGNNDYTAQLKEKEIMYNAWFEGKTTTGTPNKTIVATSALSAGNDYPSVRLVIHLNTPFEMMTYAQEVSRAGRDGNPSQCILIPSKIKLKSLEKTKSGDDHTGKQAMIDYVSKKVDCLRHAITSYCDGVGVYCYNDPGRQLCSLCQMHKDTNRPPKKDQPLPVLQNPTLKRKHYQEKDGSVFEALSKAAIVRKTEQQQNQLNYREKLSMGLSIFDDSCAYCIMNNSSSIDHPIKSCGPFKPLWDQYKQWKSSIRYPHKFPNPSCFYCHLPKAGYSHPKYGDAKKCVHPDIIPIVAYGIFIDPNLQKKASLHFETSWENLTNYSNWLTTVPSEGNLTWISAIFLWYIETAIGL